MLNKTRTRICALGEQLGKKADDLVLRRKTSFIALCAKAFMGREVEQDPRKAKVEKYLSEATNMEQTYGTVTILKEGTEVKMSVSAYQKLKMNEEQTDGRSKNTMKLAEFLEGQNSSSNGKSSNNQMTGKKRKRAKIQESLGEEEEEEEKEEKKKKKKKKA